MQKDQYLKLLLRLEKKAEEKEKEKFFRERERILRVMFTQLNREFFGGRLPRYKIRLAHFLANDRGGECDIFNKVILIAAFLAPDLYRSVLLHEMIHIEILGHGPRFRAKLQELTRLGETWAHEDIAQYIDNDDATEDQIEILKEGSGKDAWWKQLAVKRRESWNKNMNV